MYITQAIGYIPNDILNLHLHTDVCKREDPFDMPVIDITET